MSKKYINGQYVDLTHDEEAAIAAEQSKADAEDLHRQLTDSEASAFILSKIINTVDIPDDMSVRMKALYPKFEDIIGLTVSLGYKFTYGDDLYSVAQPSLTIAQHYIPGVGTESLYTRIDETHLGNLYDPIPYSGNMALEENMYYTQNGDIYYCWRSTYVAVFNTLEELNEIYVRKIIQ